MHVINRCFCPSVLFDHTFYFLSQGRDVAGIRDKVEQSIDECLEQSASEWYGSPSRGRNNTIVVVCIAAIFIIRTRSAIPETVRSAGAPSSSNQVMRSF